MLIPLALSVLLVLGGLEAAPASSVRPSEKSSHSERTVQHSRHTARKQPRHQTRNEILRSLDPASFNIIVVPTTTKHSTPSILKLHPPTALPLVMSANMPMRFGRNSDPGDWGEPNSGNNLPQRFGRSRGLVRRCVKCNQTRDVSNQGLPQRFGRNPPDWSLVRALTHQELLDTGLRWPENLDFLDKSEERTAMEDDFEE